MLAPDSALPPRGAVISADEEYRYLLWRTLPPSLLLEDLGAVLFVMLNPSTANADKDDQTLTKICAYAKRWGYTRLWVANLYALRSRHPSALCAHRDPVGPLADAYLQAAAARSSAVVVGWGDGPRQFDLGPRASHVLSLLPEATCLYVTRAGHPGHPLYLPGTARPAPYLPAA